MSKNRPVISVTPDIHVSIKYVEKMYRYAYKENIMIYVYEL